MRTVRTLGIALVYVQGLLWSQVSPGNEVYVLQTGYVLPDGERQLVPGVDQANGGRFVASTVGLVIGEDEGGEPINLVVDPGFSSNFDSVVDALISVGLTPDLITHVFISHHHPDHTLNAGLFPNATVVDFWATYKGDLWEDHPDELEIGPGIKVLRTPGHTAQDASLVVETSTPNKKVIFTHVWWFYSDGTVFPSGPAPEVDPIAEEPVQLQDSREFIGKSGEDADCIIPGHGAPFKPESSGNCSQSLVEISAP